MLHPLLNPSVATFYSYNVVIFHEEMTPVVTYALWPYCVNLHLCWLFEPVCNQ